MISGSRGARRNVLFGLGAAIISASSLASAKASCPRPFLVVSPFGSSAFRNAQALIRESMARVADCAFIIDFKPGAAGVVGARHALNLARSNDVLLLSSTTTTSLNPLLRTAAEIGRREDWQPVAQLYRMPIVLVSSKDAPAKLAELVALGRRQPERLTYASSGVGQAYHLLMEHARQALGFSAMHVPYRSNHAFSVAAGETQLAFASLEVTLPLIEAGRLNALAVLTPERLPLLPDVPALSERLPGFACYLNVGLQASAGMASQTVAALNAARNAALAPDARARIDLERTGVVVPASHPPEAYGAELEREYLFWQSLVHRLGGPAMLQE
ncbi:MAG: hypothetical protein RIS35_2536 [Pseudomonadota bacterium]